MFNTMKFLPINRRANADANMGWAQFKLPTTYQQPQLLTDLNAKKVNLAQIVNVDLEFVAVAQDNKAAEEAKTKRSVNFSIFAPGLRAVFNANKLPRSLMPKNYQVLGLVYQVINGKKNNHSLTLKSSALKLIGTLFNVPEVKVTELNTAGSLLTNGSAANNAGDNVHSEPEDDLIGTTVHPESSQLEVEPILKTYAEHVQMYEKLLANEQNPVLKALYKQAIRINQRADSSLLWGTYACLFKQAGAFNFKDKANSVNDSLKQLGDVSEVSVIEAMKNSEHPLTKALHLSTVRVVKETTSEKAINDAINLSALSIQL